MPPEETETPVEVTVEVTVPEPVVEPVEPEPTPEPVVVVVEPEPATDATDAVELQATINHEGRITALETAVALLAVQTVTPEPEPEPEPEPVIIEEPQQAPEEDSAPDNEHWWYKKGWGIF